MSTYTGVGSRKTPPEVLAKMTRVAAELAARGCTLRSGGAGGADWAFEQGSPPRLTERYLPWHGFNGHKVGRSSYEVSAYQKAKAMVLKHHPDPERLSIGGFRCMLRNAFQVLGLNLDNPSDFVMFWAPSFKRCEDGRICDAAGGTGQAVRIAFAHQVPCFLIGNPLSESQFHTFTGIEIV